MPQTTELDDEIEHSTKFNSLEYVSTMGVADVALAATDTGSNGVVYKCPANFYEVILSRFGALIQSCLQI